MIDWMYTFSLSVLLSDLSLDSNGCSLVARLLMYCIVTLCTYKYMCDVSV